MYCKVGTSLKGAIKKFKKEDRLWRNMINRCYNPNTGQYKYYGGKGVEVSDSWLIEEIFIDDLPTLLNYGKWIIDKNNLYSLDKDIIGTSLLYSKETCMFANREQQNREHEKVHNIQCINNNTNDIFIFNSLKEAESQLHIHRSTLSRILHNKQKPLKDYNFTYLNKN